MSDAFMEAVVDAVLFFAHTDDDVIEPDVAVQQLEQIASSLRKMSQREREAFIAYVKTRAVEARRQPGGQIEAERLDELLPSLGLLPEE